MTTSDQQHETDDVQGFRIPLYDDGQGGKGRPGAPPSEPHGGLFPYNIMGPTISNGYIFPNGTVIPYK